MKKLFFICVAFIPFTLQAQVWQEKFDGLANGATSDAGATAWATTSPSGGAASFSKQTPVAGYELLLINDTGSEGVWESSTINIAALAEVAIEVTLYSNFTFASDYIRCYYKIDGGSEVLFGSLQGNNGLNITSAASAIVSGNTLQIIVRAMDNTTGSTGGIINAMAFDDVTITNITVLYARSSGNWNNTATWSSEGFSGISCACTPGTNSQVIIGDGKTVSIPAASTAAGITIQDTGHLQFTGNTTLTMARGGSITIEPGGLLNNNGGNGSIVYGAYSYAVNVNGTLSISTFTANSGASITFSGNGAVTATDFIIATGRVITLNVSGGFSLSNDLTFQSTALNAALVNNFPLTIGNRMLFASANVAVTNNNTINLTSLVVNASTNNGNNLTNQNSGTMNVGSINLNNGDFTLNNSGTINQSGNFSNVDAGSSFRNLNGSTWNFSGGGTNARLFCNNGTNIFNYSANGAQSIFTPADAYSNLTLSGTGIKTSGGNLDINGDLFVAGSAQLDVSASAFGISLAGNWNITSILADPYVERTGTVTMDGNSDQTISSISGTETFHNLAINKSTGNVIQSATDVSISNVLTLTSGALSINGRTLSIKNSSTAAITRSNGCIISETTSQPYSYVNWSVGTTTGSFVFPFGKTRASADYIPFTFNVTSAGTGTAGSVSVMTYATTAENTPWPSTVLHLNNGAGLSNSANVVDRFWFINLYGYTANPVTTVTFVATPAEVGGIGALKAQRWNSSTSGWDAPKPGQTNSTLYSATVPNVSSFSPWTMSGNNVVLPVTLITFKAEENDGSVDLAWQTAQEINSDFYTVQRTLDMEQYQDVVKIKAAGTQITHSYRATDPNPLVGVSYYRLKQTDVDGTISYFKPVMINYSGTERVAIDAYPLPCNGLEMNLLINGMKPGDSLPLQLIDINGQALQLNNIRSDNSGIFNGKIVFASRLPPGLYLLKAGKSAYYQVRVMVEY